MKGQGRALPAGVLIAIGVGLVAFAGLPLGLVIARALGFPGDPSATRWLAVLTSPSNLSALRATLAISTGATALAVALGVPLAFALSRVALPGRARWRALLSLPAAVPPYLWGIAWIDLANPRTGLLNELARRLGAEGALVDIYGTGGIVWVLGLSFFPLVMLPVSAALERMDASLEEAARLAGAGPLRALAGITLPLAVPTIASSAVLVFLLAASAFGVPYLLGTGGSARTFVLTTAIVNAMNVGGAESLRNAMALALGLLLLSTAAGALGTALARGERRHAVVSGKGQRPRPVMLPAAARGTVTAIVAGVAFTAVALPVATLAVVSLVEAWGAGLGPSNWGLGNYQRVLFQNRETGPALMRSVVLGVAAATIAVTVGAVIAYARLRRGGLATRALEALANAPYAVPGTVLAIGLVLAWSREVRLIAFDRVTLVIDLFAGSWALLIAYAVKYLSFGVRTTASALGQLDPALEEAARVSGASATRAAVDVVAPLLRPALGAAWLLVFLPVLSEITMSVLLVGPGTSVVGTVLFELQSYADPPAAAVLACVLVAATLAGDALLRRLRARRGSLS